MKSKFPTKPPFEVLWAWNVKFVGSEGWKRREEIIEKYPEYFPWEHKMKKVPDEVHEAYRKETDPHYGMTFEQIWDSLPKGKGIRDAIREQGEPISMKPLTFQEMEDIFREMQEEEERQRIKREEELSRLEIIWNKHYGKYGIKFRGW